MQRLPLHGLLQGWSAYMTAEDLAPATMKSYRYYVLRFIADRVVEPADATPGDVTAFLAALRRGPSKAQGKRAVRHLFRWMRASGQRADDPTELVGRTRRRRTAPAHLSEEELCRLVYTAANHSTEWAWVLVLMFATGTRVGEACALRPGDVDLERGLVTIRAPKNRIDRVVHLGPSGLAAATFLRDGRPTLLRVKPPGIRARMTKLGLRARLPQEKRHPHVLRHTCGTILSERGASQEEIMEHLGHVDPAMVSWYIHVTSGRAKRTAALL